MSEPRMSERDQIIQAMARAMHAHDYTSPYEELWEPSRQNLLGLAEAALEAVEDDFPCAPWLT